MDMQTVFQTLKRWWMAFAHALGWFNTRLLLTLAYIVIVGIPALVLKLIRKDLLDRRLRDRPTYWVSKEKTVHSLEHARHPF